MYHETACCRANNEISMMHLNVFLLAKCIVYINESGFLVIKIYYRLELVNCSYEHHGPLCNLRHNADKLQFCSTTPSVNFSKIGAFSKIVAFRSLSMYSLHCLEQFCIAWNNRHSNMISRALVFSCCDLAQLPFTARIVSCMLKGYIPILNLYLKLIFGKVLEE